jgi:hypothetical protein
MKLEWHSCTMLPLFRTVLWQGRLHFALRFRAKTPCAEQFKEQLLRIRLQVNSMPWAHGGKAWLALIYSVPSMPLAGKEALPNPHSRRDFSAGLTCLGDTRILHTPMIAPPARE